MTAARGNGQSSERLCFTVPVLLAKRQYVDVMDEMMAYYR